MDEQSKEPQKRKRVRSPNYPGIDLEEALERARVLHRYEDRNTAPINVVLGHWGYKANSGPGLVVVAAMKKFGLATDEGSGDKRKVKLSDAALRIILDERDDPSDRLKALQDAALSPTIHAELWQKYGGSLPSDQTLKYHLRNDRKFTEGGAEEFIRQFRSTLAFAKLGNGGKLSGDEEDKEEDESEGLMTLPTALKQVPLPPTSTKREQRVFPIPISRAESAALQITYPLTAKGWELMIKVLEAMKPGMVEDDSKEATPKDVDKEANE